MKHTKRLLAILIAALILAVSAAPALAASVYTPLAGNTIATSGHYTINEEFIIQAADTPIPSVTYTLTFGNMTIFSSSDVQYGIAADVDKEANKTLNGKTLTVSISAEDAYTKTNVNSEDDNKYDKKIEKPYVYTYTDGEGAEQTQNYIDFSGFSFSQPGIYYWEVTKSKDSGAPSEVSNNALLNQDDDKFYLVLRVDDDNGVLKPTLGLVETLAGTTKYDIIKDQYPANKSELEVKKEVAGNQASRDQYFKFKVSLENTSFKNVALDISYSRQGAFAPLNGEAVDTTKDNPTSVTLDNTGKAEAVIWLRHDEVFEFETLPKNTKVTVEEINADGYTIKSLTATGGGLTTDSATGKATGTIGETGVKVVYINEKNTPTPTGITLQMAAPLFGIVLAGLLMAVVLFSKRRENH